ncbi:hypothetical protein AB836_01105 [Rickettsiales bacterium (ex Bugula neritina AB1)]|nr:hypothetical protein AB836_01105 [Rickettsiales bacterium (ex Bugula neritina AB1)]
MNYKHIHFIGISGISMSAIGEFTKIIYPNITITGSTNDKEFKLNDIEINLHNKNNITKNIDLIVYSSAISKNNEEIIEGKKQKIPLIKRCKFLNLITKKGTRVLITGSRGKTSTTTFLWQFLKDLNPSLFVGAEIGTLNKAFFKGKNDLFIVEGDESDASILHLPSKYTIITNLGNDHLENYKDSYEEYLACFKKYLLKIKKIKDHLIIYFGDDKILDNLVKSIKGLKGISYGINKYNDIIINILEEKFNYLKWQINQDIFSVNISGIFNTLNITAAITLSNIFNIKVNNNIILEKPKRRMEYYQKNNRIIIDDYGVQPIAIKLVMKTVFKFFKKKDINIWWEPHRSTRVNRFIKDFKKIFNNTNIFIAPLYEPQMTNEYNKSIENLQKYFNYNKNVISYDNLENIFKENSKNKITLIFSAGILSKKIINIFNKI